MNEVCRFDGFELHATERRLLRDGGPIDLSPRYFDALCLLIREEGRLVTKTRFLEEIWAGVPVTDEALTQCIRTLRRQLGDDAVRPRFIETVPKHGYRFIAPVERVELRRAAPTARSASTNAATRTVLIPAAGGALGAGGAGVLGGLLYGTLGVAPVTGAGMGSGSVMLVLVALTAVVAVLGGAGVSLGVAAGGLARRHRFVLTMLGGAVGGAIVGGVVEALGMEAFTLLFGRAPGDITGAAEGAVLGGAVGLAAGWAVRQRGRWAVRKGVLAASLCGASSGVAIPSMDGRLMGGSLEMLARSFPGSRLRLERIGAIFGEPGFGPLSQTVTAAAEAGLFAACLVAGVMLARRALETPDGQPR